MLPLIRTTEAVGTSKAKLGPARDRKAKTISWTNKLLVIEAGNVSGTSFRRKLG